MNSIGDKRQAVGDDTAYYLNDSYRKIKESCPKQLGSLHIIGMMMMVVMVMTVTVVMHMVAMLVVCVHIVIVFLIRL